VAKKLAAAVSAVSAAERDVLLATKLHVPGSRPGFVPRPRLANGSTTPGARADAGLRPGQLIDHGHKVTRIYRSPRNAERVRALGAEPIALDQQPAGVWRRIVGGS
jgi:hypothetical protein